MANSTSVNPHPPITSKRELKEALEQFWVCETQIKEAKKEANEERKMRLAPIKALEVAVKELEPAIRDYMSGKNMKAVRTHGKIFQLETNKSKRKMTVDELAELLAARGIEDAQSIIDLTQTKKEKDNHKITYEVQVQDDDEEGED